MKKIKNIITLNILLAIAHSGIAQDLSPLLQTYIQQALEHNPDLASSRMNYEVSREQANAVDALPNTEFGVGYFVSEPETRTGAQRARFSVKQMIPWFGNISARQDYITSLSDAQAMEVHIRERKLILELSSVYYELYAISKKIDMINRQLELTESYEQLALNAVETGKGSAVAVLKLQIRENELKNSRSRLNRKEETERVRFYNLIGKASSAPVTLPDTLMVAPESAAEIRVNLDLHPELVRYEALYESVVRSEIVNKKEASPNLGIGLDYIPVEKRTDINPTDNGKDVIMPMVTLSIPIFNSKFRSVSRQNEMKKESLEFEQRERRNRLQTTLTEALNAKTIAAGNVNTLKANIQETANAMEILLRSYETGTIDFNELLEIQDMQLRFETDLIEEVRSWYNTSLIINYLSSTS